MLSKRIVLAVAVCFFQFISADRITVQDCGTAPDSIVNFVDVDGCNALPCVLTKGGIAKVTVGFTSAFPADGGYVKCFANILDINVPIRLTESDICKLGAKCPIQSGDYNEASISLDVKHTYPSISATVECRVYDLRNSVHICKKLPVTIQN